MKKLLSLFIVITALASCTSDVKFNDPGFQASKDNFVWRADMTTATFVSDGDVDHPTVGVMTLNAYRGLETVTLTFPFDTAIPITKFNPVTYEYIPRIPSDLDLNDPITASYTYEDQGFALEYSTVPPDGEEIRGNLEIAISEYNTASKTVTGTFKFNAKYTGESELANDNVNFQQGAFYHIAFQ